MHWRAGRECMYSGQQGYMWYHGALRGVEGVGGHWGQGIGVVRGALGAGRECRYSGATIGIGGIRRLLGGVGAVRGCRGALVGWQGV